MVAPIRLFTLPDAHTQVCALVRLMDLRETDACCDWFRRNVRRACDERLVSPKRSDPLLLRGHAEGHVVRECRFLCT